MADVRFGFDNEESESERPLLQRFEVKYPSRQLNTEAMLERLASFVLIIFPASATAWIASFPASGSSFKCRCCDPLYSSHDEWSATDDWESLSGANAIPDSDEIYNSDMLTLQALKMQHFGMNEQGEEPSDEDKWLNSVIEDIFVKGDEEQPRTTLHEEKFIDEMGKEIALLVRCNESPEILNVAEGRAIPKLTEEQKDDVRQLVFQDKDTWKPTTFFKEALSTVFQTHSTVTNGDAPAMNKRCVANWMEQSLNESVGHHERRVIQTIAHHGTYGSGALSEQNFLDMYMSVLTGVPCEPARNLEHLKRFRNEQIQAVWRDLRSHGIVSPAEFQHKMDLAEIESQSGDEHAHVLSADFLDECEILEESLEGDAVVSGMTDRHGKSSHERVKLVPGEKVPLWIKDGDFVFIDEQSCIGCMQCVSASPASFQMLEHNGRARTFFQRKAPDVLTAVAACPVDCMHFVSFEELKELESARDDGVADDHRHFGNSPTRGYVAATPLHVSRRDSDANHRSSFYHFLRNKCFKSSSCPTRGCFDCPKFAESGSNPFFQERLKRDTHIRAEYFKQTGMADSFRKSADF